jgi:hypothetical protein
VNIRKHHGGNYPEIRSLDWYRSQGYQLIDWDGRSPRSITDRTGARIAVLAGRPDDIDFRKACADAYNAIQIEGAQIKFEDDQLRHKRGDFPAVNIGVSHGGGTKEPTNLNVGRAAGAAERLLQNEGLRRLSEFQDGEPLTLTLDPNVFDYF